MPVRLITGLGNPGPEYSATRHNAGFWFVDVLADSYGLAFRPQQKFHADVCRLTTGGQDCWLCKPATFMNESGAAVQALADFYRIPAGQILVVHDDIDLEAGMVRLKKGGGHGGHNGLRDIIKRTGDNSFIRLRIGVGHPGNRQLVTPHVLGRPDMEDLALIRTAISATMEVMTSVLEGNLQEAMNSLHRKKEQEDGVDT